MSLIYQDQLTAILLSGCGKNGGKGLRAVKKRKGLTFVQTATPSDDEKTLDLLYEPHLVDYVGTPRSIAQVLNLLRLQQEKSTPTFSQKNPVREFDELIYFLSQHSKINFTQYKKSVLFSGLEKFIQESPGLSISSLIDSLISDDRAIYELSYRLLNPSTRFFKNPEVWEELYEKYILRIVEEKHPSETVRIWCSGCSTGEEAYTLAILFDKALRVLNKNLKVQVFANDVNGFAINSAFFGRYPQSIAQDLPGDLLITYFDECEEGFRIKKSIKDRVIFARHNLLTSPPFPKIDLVLCRNILSSFIPSAQKKCLNKFHYALSDSGVLILGSNEELRGMGNLFEAVHQRYKIFKKIDREEDENKILNFIDRDFYLKKNYTPKSGNEVSRWIGQTIVQHLNLSYLILDQNLNVLTIKGSLEPHITPHFAGPSVSFLDSFSDDLFFAIHQVANHLDASQEKRISLPDVPISLLGQEERVTVVGSYSGPFWIKNQLAKYLIILIPQSLKATYLRKKAPDQYTFEDRGSVHSDLAPKSPNKRTILKSFQSSNSLLQRENQQLRSEIGVLEYINEELQLVISDHQSKNGQLEELTTDLDHLLKSTQLGTLYLDKELNIRKFTPVTSELFCLKESDIGRPIQLFHTYFKRVNTHNLQVKAGEILTRRADIIEDEVQTLDNRWYLQRIVPYINSLGLVDGVVINYIPITKLKTTEADLQRNQERLSTILEYTQSIILSLSPTGEIQFVNQSKIFDKAYPENGIKFQDYLPDRSHILTFEENLKEVLQTLEKREFQSSIQITGAELPHHFLNRLTPVFRKGQLTGVNLISSNITELQNLSTTLKVQNGELEKMNQELAQFAYIASHDLKEPVKTINGFAHLFRKKFGKELPNPSADQFIQYIIEASNRMEELIQGLLDYSKMGRDKRLSEVNVEDLITSIGQDLASTLKETQGSIFTVKKLPIVQGYKMELRMIFQNLISNGLKFRFPQRPPLIQIDFSEDDTHWRFYVKDNGIGIREEYHHKIFQIFQRLHTRSAYAGSGIGLAICHKNVLLHGGTIQVQSEGDTGSTFIFTIAKGM